MINGVSLLVITGSTGIIITHSVRMRNEKLQSFCLFFLVSVVQIQWLNRQVAQGALTQEGLYMSEEAVAESTWQKVRARARLG